MSVSFIESDPYNRLRLKFKVSDTTTVVELTEEAIMDYYELANVSEYLQKPEEEKELLLIKIMAWLEEADATVSIPSNISITYSKLIQIMEKI